MSKKNESEADIQNEKIAELEQKVGELTAGWQRTQADFINYKKQVESDRVRWASLAKADLIENILPIFDNFELAAKHVPEELKMNNWAVGITMIEKQLLEVLKNEGLERISSVGQSFDPAIHEAVEDVESDEPEGTIVEEVASGYSFAGNVIRPAKVKVSKGKN